MNYLKLFIPILIYVGLAAQIPSWQPVTADVAANEMYELNRQYRIANSYSCEVCYSSYDTYSDVKPVESKKGYVIKSGSDYKSDVLDILTIQNKSYRLTVDQKRKTIKVSAALIVPDEIFSVDAVKTSLKNCSKIYKRTETNDVIYRLEKNAISSIPAQEFNFGSKFIQKITTYYNVKNSTRKGETIVEEISKPRLEIVFTNFSSKIKLAKNTFNLNEFVIITNKTITSTPKYHDYKIFDGRIR